MFASQKLGLASIDNILTRIRIHVRLKQIYKKGKQMGRYGKKAQETVKETMEKYKEGKLKSGKSGAKVKSRKQAVAIGLSEARQKGQKVPPPPKK